MREQEAQMPLFNLIFLGLGWPWVGEFVGFIIIFTCFPTQQNLVYRKRPIYEAGASAFSCFLPVVGTTPTWNDAYMFYRFYAFEIIYGSSRSIFSRLEPARCVPTCGRGNDVAVPDGTGRDDDPVETGREVLVLPNHKRHHT